MKAADYGTGRRGLDWGVKACKYDPFFFFGGALSMSSQHTAAREIGSQDVEETSAWLVIVFLFFFSEFV